MYQLSDNQIDIIHSKLMESSTLNNGIEPEILDHICCIMEEMLSTGKESFENALEQAFTMVCPNGIGEIEIEKSILLTHHKRLIMRKAVYISGYFATTSIALGIMFKYFRWESGNILLLAGFSILLVYALLLLFSDKSGFKKKTGNEKIQIVSGLLACLLIITGCVFKLMNYHGGNALLLSGFTFLIILFLPALFYGLYKRPVNK